MKISVVHNVYLRNPYILESIEYNLGALHAANADYQYIIFNDNGDTKIKEDIKPILGHLNVEYIYSPINYGKKMCHGGWIGSVPYLTGELVQNTDQDDVMTEDFYKKCLAEFEKDPELYLTFTNCYRTNEKLDPNSIMSNPDYTPDYSQPLERFKDWFGVDENGKQGVTRANNNMPGPGVIYKTKLHDEIGLPDLENFKGAGDFEYWARILYNNKKCKYINEPLWLYRNSSFSAGNEIIEGKPNRGYWQQLHIQAIQEKYTKLWNQKLKTV